VSTDEQLAGSPKWPFIGAVLAVLWVFVRGPELHVGPLATEFGIGIGVGMGVAYLLRRMYQSQFALDGSLAAIPAAVTYLLLFVWELLTANVDVARRVLLPSMPIDPAVIELPLRVESDAAITTIANSITLTPGTLTMDYDADRHALYIHAINCPDPDAVVAPIRSWEDYALVIFNEDQSPDDPAPTPEIHEDVGEFDDLIEETGEDVSHLHDADAEGGEGTEGEIPAEEEGGETDGE